MENLNAEQIIKAFEVCRDKDLCNECPYEENIDCLRLREKHAIALMKSQEQKIFELENRLKECENGYEGTLFLDRCKLHDAEEKVKQLTQAHEMLSESYDHLEKTKDELLAERSRLTEENNFLKEELRNATAEVFMLRERNADLHASCTELERKCASLDDENERLKWQNAHLECVGEVAVKNRDECEQQLHYLSNVEIPYLYEALEGKGKDADKLLDILSNALEKAKADTVREMQERLKECFDNEIEHMSIYTESQVLFVIDQIAKEMLEGEK